MGHDLYLANNIKRLKEVANYQPDTFKAFSQFDQQVFKEGKLTNKLKELIAIACAHITGCPYCIEGHVTKAKKLEISFDEIAEAIHVATALKAGAAMAHGLNALNAYTSEGEAQSLYHSSYGKRFKELANSNPNSFLAFHSYDQNALKAGLLTKREKELIAIACAHITGCPYCIEAHVSNAKKENITFEEISESIFVAVALNAGAALAHSVNALNAFDHEYPK